MKTMGGPTLRWRKTAATTCGPACPAQAGRARGRSTRFAHLGTGAHRRCSFVFVDPGGRFGRSFGGICSARDGDSARDFTDVRRPGGRGGTKRGESPSRATPAGGAKARECQVGKFREPIKTSRTRHWRAVLVRPNSDEVKLGIRGDQNPMKWGVADLRRGGQIPA